MERREGMRARGKGVFMMRRGSQEAHCWRTAGGSVRTPAAGTVDARAQLPLVWYTLLAGYSQVEMWVQALM